MKLLTEADGRALAIEMLAEMVGYETAPGDVESLWPWSIAAMYRPEGTAQDNVLLRYLDVIRKRGGREALAGFCSIITDHLGQEGTGGGTCHLWVYEKLSERDIAGKPGPWPKMEDDEPSATLQ